MRVHTCARAYVLAMPYVGVLVFVRVSVVVLTVRFLNLFIFHKTVQTEVLL